MVNVEEKKICYHCGLECPNEQIKINDKYFFNHHYLKAERWIESDVEDLHQKIKTYMNSFNYRIQT